MIYNQTLQTIGVNLIWQTALIACVVFFALKVLPRNQPQIRYRIALSGLLGTLLLMAAPFLPALSPSLSVGVAPVQTLPVFVATILPAAEAAGGGAVSPISTISVSPLPTLSALFMGLWILGSLFRFSQLILAAYQGVIWRKRAEPGRLLGTKPLSRNVTILRSKNIDAPMVLGFLRPSILVPQGFSLDTDQPEIRAVLEHETAHICRHDLWVNLIQKLVLALLWWCAPLYWVDRQINMEREKLCDDMAITTINGGTIKGGTARDLARALINLAEGHMQKPTPLLAIGIRFKTSLLAERVQRLCQPKSGPVISKKILLASSMAVPLTLAALTTITPRALAHNPPNAGAGFDVQASNTEISALQYALYNAAERNRANDVDMLLQMNVNPNFVLRGDGTPLMAAVRHNNREVIVQLIRAGASVNLAAPGDGNPLILAAMRGDVDMAKLLLDKGADVNAEVPGDETPLINAAQQGHLNMAMFLVKNGANVSLGAWTYHYEDGTRKEWRTPLGEAKKHGHKNMVQYLQSKGAKLASGPRNTSPVDIVQGRVTSQYGSVRKGEAHRGIDIANKLGTPIYAPADGRILEATDTYKGQTTWGKTVVLESAGNVQTSFSHLRDYIVRTGNVVKAGEIIAYMGNTGKSSGPHVHIETLVDGKLVDPLTVWSALKNVQGP